MPFAAVGLAAGLIIPPAVAMGVAALPMLGDALSLRRSAERGRRRIEVAVRVGRLVHELQKERGLSVAALTRRDDPSRQALTVQRPLGAAALAALLAALAEAGLPGGEAMEGVAGLDVLRRRIDALDPTGSEAVQAFSEAIGRLLALSSDMVRGAARGRLSRLALALVNLISAKEMSGQERALISNAVGAGAMDDGLRRKVIQAVGGQEIYLRLYRDLAGAQAVEALDSDLSRVDPPVLEVRNALLRENRMPSLAVTEWFARATARIDALKVHEDRMADILLAATDGQERMARRRPWAIAASVALSLAVLAVAAWTLPLAT